MEWNIFCNMKWNEKKNVEWNGTDVGWYAECDCVISCAYSEALLKLRVGF